MKRFFALMICLAMAMSLAACGVDADTIHDSVTQTFDMNNATIMSKTETVSGDVVHMVVENNEYSVTIEMSKDESAQLSVGDTIDCVIELELGHYITGYTFGFTIKSPYCKCIGISYKSK